MESGEMRDDMYILIVGNVVDGLRFEGPFDCPSDAAEYAERYYKNEEYWVADLLTPEPVDPCPKDECPRDGSQCSVTNHDLCGNWEQCPPDPDVEYEGCGGECCDDCNCESGEGGTWWRLTDSVINHICNGDMFKAVIAAHLNRQAVDIGAAIGDMEGVPWVIDDSRWYGIEEE
jgi:hypothetical protein